MSYINAETFFINKVKDSAIQGQREYGVLASLTLAQAILESNWGKSSLSKNANNIFGIKADKYWKGAYMEFPTKEYLNGKWVTVNAKFRRYSSIDESIQDHTIFLTKPRYKNVIGQTDYKKATYEIWKAGYATDPNYPNKLNDIIERYELYEYDNVDTDSATPTRPPNFAWGLNDRGDEVIKLQKDLMSLGYSVGEYGADGIFGKSTENAVKQFQLDNFLLSDGLAGNDTLVKIEEKLYELEQGNINKPIEEAKPSISKEQKALNNLREYGMIVNDVDFGRMITHGELFIILDSLISKIFKNNLK